LLSELDRTKFQEDGYVVWRDVLSPAEVDELMAEADRVVDWAVRSSRERGAWNPRMDVAADDAGRQIVRSISPMLDLSPKIARLTEDSRFRGRARALLGSDVVLIDEKLNTKTIIEADCGPPNVGSGGWTPHQDWGYLRPTGCPDAGATFVIPLDEARGRGPIVLYPGSHLQPPAYADADPAHGNGRVDLKKMKLPQRKEITEPPGSVVAFDFRMIHQSKPNRSLKPRRLFIIAYASTDAGATAETRRRWQLQRSSAAARFETRIPEAAL